MVDVLNTRYSCTKNVLLVRERWRVFELSLSLSLGMNCLFSRSLRIPTRKLRPWYNQMANHDIDYGILVLMVLCVVYAELCGVCHGHAPRVFTNSYADVRNTRVTCDRSHKHIVEDNTLSFVLQESGAKEYGIVTWAMIVGIRLCVLLHGRYVLRTTDTCRCMDTECSIHEARTSQCACSECVRI